VANTVLVVDDSPSIRHVVRALLEYHVERLLVCEAVDGADAIEKARAVRPDLILLDLVMPRLNGAEAASALRKAMPKTPIILLTLYPERVGEILPSAIGVDVVLSKPDCVLKLLDFVKTLFPPSTALW
jgi:CheY-like chemotaxis protein